MKTIEEYSQGGRAGGRLKYFLLRCVSTATDSDSNTHLCQPPDVLPAHVGLEQLGAPQRGRGEALEGLRQVLLRDVGQATARVGSLQRIRIRVPGTGAK